MDTAHDGLRCIGAARPPTILRAYGGAVGDSSDQGNEADIIQLVTKLAGSGVELSVPAQASWMLRLEPIQLDASTTGTPPRTVTTMLAALVAGLPEVGRSLAASPGVRVLFSAETRQLLASGELRLMQTATGVAPTAINAAGRIVETARMAPGAASVAGGGVAVGAALAGSWPILLAGGLAAAAAAAEQRWLEQTLGGLQAAVERLEHRLRDDDAGTLEAAMRLSRLVEPAALGAALPMQLRLELAAARQEVERVYLSRLRFVDRFERALEAAQNEEEQKTGQPIAWAGDIARDLADRKTGLVDELVVFLQAMIVRARLAACTAGVLAAEGGEQPAVMLLASLDQELRHDYWNLQRPIHALAKSQPTASPWQRARAVVGNRLPLLATGDQEQAVAVIRELDDEMRRTVGAALPDRDEAVEITVAMDDVRALGVA